MIEDIIKSIKASVYDRTTSPLFGAFFLSWALWNHRLLITLFSSMPLSEKFSFIDTNLYFGLHAKLGILIGYPILTTALFIFVYPYPARFVYEFWRNRQKELKAIKQKIDDETPLTREESRDIKRKLVELELEYEKEIEKRDINIDRLKKVIEKNEDYFRPVKKSAMRAVTKKSKNKN